MTHKQAKQIIKAEQRCTDYPFKLRNLIAIKSDNAIFDNGKDGVYKSIFEIRNNKAVLV